MPLVDEFTEQGLVAKDLLSAGGFTGIGVTGQAAQGVGRNTEFDSEIARHHHILLYISFQRRTDDEKTSGRLARRAFVAHAKLQGRVQTPQPWPDVPAQINKT